ncbi:MAG TPA: hypothetical protein VGN52_14465 [Burkholderiales bacterium]|jgi:hypothetical protein
MKQSAAICRALVASIFAGLLATGCAVPGGTPLGQPQGAPVRMGASVAEVQQALGTSAQPRARGAASEIVLKARGVQVLFDGASRVSTVRLDRPWDGAVMGVRIGDSDEAMLARLGTAKIIRTPEAAGYTYFPDSATMVTYVVNREHRIETIFLEH